MATRRTVLSALAAARAGRAVVARPVARSSVIARVAPAVRWSSSAAPEPVAQTSASAAASSLASASASAPVDTPEPSAAAPAAEAEPTPATPAPETPSSPAASSATEPEPISPEAWIRAGIHPDVAAQLVVAYPEAAAPTPAQCGFLLALLRGDTDVMVKDYMGRGKTFSLALAAMSMARSSNGKHQTVMLFPTPHLAQQVSDLLVAMAPAGQIQHTLVASEDHDNWDAPIIVATPRMLHNARPPALPRLTHIMLDEPDVMLGPLPGRYVSAHTLAKHPVNRHPPPVAAVLNRLLGIRTGARGAIDFSGRRADVHTVWASATLSSALRRFAYGRGWTTNPAHGGNAKRGIVDLNFTAGASEGQREVVDTLRRIGVAAGAEGVEPVSRAKPEHYALVVEPTGRIHPLQLWETVVDADGRRDTTPVSKGEKDGLVQLTLIEAVALLHATSPPPPGTYALVLPPRSASLRALADEIAKLGIDVAPLVPEALEGGGVPRPDPATGTAPVLIASRAAMAGLHLANLHTVYLLNGIDMASLSPAQVKLGGRHERAVAYDVIAGRMGRMGTDVVPGHPQRVISLVSEGSYEEHALNELFTGRLNKNSAMMFPLSRWTGTL